MKKLIILACCILFPMLSYSASTGSVTLTQVSTGTTGLVYVYTTQATKTNPAGCSKDYAYAIESTIPAKKEFLAILLTALSSGKQVQLSVHDSQCLTIGANTFPKLFNVVVKS